MEVCTDSFRGAIPYANVKLFQKNDVGLILLPHTQTHTHTFGSISEEMYDQETQYVSIVRGNKDAEPN